MKIVLTGASSGIGKAIKEELKEFEIISLCRNCDIKVDFNNIEEVKKIKIKDIKGIIHNAGVGYFGQFEDIKVEYIQEMINVNFLAPMIITKNHLKEIKKNNGFIINISSTSSRSPSKFGVVYSATKSAINQFAKSLFEEVRKNRVKICTILPDLTLTNFHKNTFFKPSNEELAHLKPTDIAKIIKDIIYSPSNIVINEIVIKPQIFKIDKTK